MPLLRSQKEAKELKDELFAKKSQRVASSSARHSRWRVARRGGAHPDGGPPPQESDEHSRLTAYLETLKKRHDDLFTDGNRKERAVQDKTDAVRARRRGPLTHALVRVLFSHSPLPLATPPSSFP